MPAPIRTKIFSDNRSDSDSSSDPGLEREDSDDEDESGDNTHNDEVQERQCGLHSISTYQL